MEQIQFNQKENYLDYRKNQLLQVIKEFNITNYQQKLASLLQEYNNQINDILENGLETGILISNIEPITDLVKYREQYYFYGKNNKLYFIDMIN